MNSDSNTAMTLVDYAEREAEKLHTAHIDDFSALQNQVNALAAFIVAALSGILGYVMNLVTAPASTGIQWELFVAATTLLIYLFCCGAFLAYSCMKIGAIRHHGINPKALLTPTNKGCSLDDVREELLNNVDAAIMQNRARNAKTGHAFNRALLAVLIAPFIFLVAWGAAVWVVN